MIIQVSYYKINPDKVTILSPRGTSFVAKWLDKSNVWLHFLLNTEGTSWHITASKSKKEAMEGWPKIYRDPEGKFSKWLLTQPEVRVIVADNKPV